MTTFCNGLGLVAKLWTIECSSSVSDAQGMCFASQSDVIYRRFVLSKFFAKGWGDISVYERLVEARKVIVDRTKSNNLTSTHYPVQLDNSWTKETCYIAEGHFTSPLAQHFPGLLPKESEKAHFQVIVPKKWSKNGRKPMCLHLAGTGDHYFWRRRNFMAKPLMKESGIASILLENPYYGVRKPKDQLRSSLKYVVDLLVMGAALVLESLVLLHWCDQQGFGPLGITGISMGGHMASLASTAWPKPLAIVPCLSWSTASCVFTQGVLKRACSWNTLEEQLSDENYVKNLLNFVPINGNSISDFNDNVHFSYSEKSDSHSNISPRTMLRNLPEGGSRTLCLSNEDIYNDINSSAIEYIPSFMKVGADPSPKPATVDFMNYLMDKATHLRYFPKPVDPTLARFIVAKHDGYVPRNNVMSPCDIWPGCTVECVTGGHVVASLRHQDVFRKVIMDTLSQLT